MTTHSASRPAEPRPLARQLSTPTPLPGEDRGLTLLRRGLLAGIGVLALVAGVFRIGRPAPWADEGVTVLVVRRSWGGILGLAGGADAPMVLYYLLAKAWSQALWWLPTLTAVRTLSATAAALAVVCLAALVARYSGLATGVLAGLLLTGLPGFTRYAQEARPYALLTFATVAGWLAWAAWRRAEPVPSDPGASGAGASLAGSSGTSEPPLRRALTVAAGSWRYLVTLAIAPLVHLFGLLQWPAQVLADLTAPGLAMRARLRRALTTVALMVAVLVVIGYPVLIAVLRGTGPTRLRALSRLDRVFAQTITGFIKIGPAVPLLVLAGVGLLAGLLRSRYTTPQRDLVRVAAWWFAVPLLLGIAIAAVKPALFRARYWQPLLPPLAALAAVGLVVLVQAAFGLVRGTGTVPRRRVAVAAGLALVVGAVGVGAFAVTALPLHARLREPAGHRVSLAPALQRVDSLLAAYPGTPVLVSPRSRSVVFLAARPELENPLVRVEDAAASVWPAIESPAAVAGKLEGHDRAIWVLADRGSTPRPVAAPEILDGTGFELVELKRAGTWWVGVLER
jgi:hypothetical protein